jgi:dihydrofolate reductase
MYETMAVWETDPSLAALSPYTGEYAEIWQAADKIVFSRTLKTISTTKTRIDRNFDPQAIRDLKASATRDISIGGPNLAAYAFEAGLVDQIYLFIAPVIVGGGKRGLPDDVTLRLELEDQRRFGNGMVFVKYRVRA